MLNYLISSQARLDILSFFFANIEKRYYAREIVKTLNLDQANVHKELANLVKGGILINEIVDNKKYFFVNQKNEFFLDLASMFKKYNAGKNGPEIFCLEEMPNYYPLFTSPAWNEGMANKFSRLYNFKTSLNTLVTIFENNFSFIK